MCIILENEKKLFNYLTLSPRKAEIPAYRSLIYSREAKISAENFETKLLQTMLCLGALGLGTRAVGA